MTQPIQMRFNELISGARSDVAVAIYGDDLDQMGATARQSRGRACESAGVSRTACRSDPGISELRYQIRPRWHRALRTDNGGRCRYRGGGARRPAGGPAVQRRPPLRDRRSRARRSAQRPRSIGCASRHAARNQRLPRRIGTFAAAGELRVFGRIERDQPGQRQAAHLRRGQCARPRYRRPSWTRRKRRSPATCGLPPGLVARMGRPVREKSSAGHPPAGVRRSGLHGLDFRALYMALGSMPLALTVFTAVPLALAGGVFAIALRGIPFSVSAAVGFIAVSGVAGSTDLSSWHLSGGDCRAAKKSQMRSSTARSNGSGPC